MGGEDGPGIALADLLALMPAVATHPMPSPDALLLVPCAEADLPERLMRLAVIALGDGSAAMPSAALFRAAVNRVVPAGWVAAALPCEPHGGPLAAAVRDALATNSLRLCVRRNVMAGGVALVCRKIAPVRELRHARRG